MIEIDGDQEVDLEIVTGEDQGVGTEGGRVQETDIALIVEDN